MIGFIVLGVALLLSGLVAAVMRFRNGRFVAKPVSEDIVVLTEAQIGAPLGSTATLVQFSTSVCAPCRATRVLLTDIADTTDGVETVEIDAENHLDLVRELSIMRTPTVLVLDARGAISSRASGLARRDQVLAAVEQVSASI